MNKIGKILFGVALIVVGVLFALNALGFADINIFFDGWWTLFIIVPCCIGLFSENDKVGNIIGILFGVFLLLCCQGVVEFNLIWKLLIPAIIVIIGIKMIVKAIFGGKASELLLKSRQNGNKLTSGCATFSGHDMNFDGENFEGAELTAVFGGVKCDLRNAIIQNDCAIDATAVFGGIDIFVPDNIKVKIVSNSIFGGVSNRKKNTNTDGAVTVYIKATCMFGGVEIK